MKTRYITEAMAGVLPIILSICAISRGIAMGARETGSTGGESLPLVAQQTCNCSQSTLISFECLCLDLSSLAHGQDRIFLSKHLSDTPEIIDFVVRCKRKSSTNTSGLFDFLPTSVKKLKLAGCFQQHVGKNVFYSISEVEEVAIENFPPDELEFCGNYLDVINKSFPPVELDPELFLSMPQVQKLTLAFLSLDRFPKALYQDVNGTYPLPNLKSLTLTGNKIPDLKPEYLQHLTKLRSLNIEANTISNLSTTFPFLPSLQVLNVGTNRIRSLVGSPFENLRNLKSLDLYQQLSSDKDSSKHQSFDNHGLGAMEFIFPTSFLGLSKLKSLHLTVSNIRSIPNNAFRDLVDLERLNLCDGLIEYIGASGFQGLSLLQSLDLSYNNLSAIDPSVFSSLNSVRFLYLQGNSLRSLSGATFENMPYLSCLNLGKNRLTTLTRDIFSPLLNLRKLYVHGNELVSVEEVFSGITSEFCGIIDLSYNNVETLDISSLQILGNVDRTVHVDLSHNKLRVLHVTESYGSADMGFLAVRLDLRWNKFTSLPFELAKYWSFSRSMISIPSVFGRNNGDISLQMVHNPLTCDCGLYDLILNLDVAKGGVLYSKTDFQYMECTFPDTMTGRRVEEISPSGLWCSHECYNRLYYCLCFERAGELLRSSAPECEFERNEACPSECSCSFQGQLHSSTSPYNELVNCSWRNLTSVPDDISNATTILHLEGNQLRVINRTVLPKLSMTRELYLNDNNITHVGDMSFDNFTSLEILRLDGNNIPEINSAAFKSLSRLRELYLNNSGVKYVEADTFQNLANLRELQLENNKLKSIPENMFSGLKKLTLLGIRGNPLTCGCDVLWFANWLRSRVYLLSQGRNVSCVASAKVSREILSLSVAEFDCEDLQAAQARTRLIIGLSIPLVLVTILFFCVIVVVKQKEAIQVYLYARYGWRFREEDDEDKEYDAFLSYSQHDLDVVLQDVLPALENREPPFRVCLHHRDFLPGIPIAENILNAVSASKRTIILLSNNFLESDWCQLEFQAAHAQMLQDRANRVIVILLDDIPAENAPADIQHYLKTNTYLKWGDERFWERLIYAMPRPRPHAQNEDGDRLALVELDHNAFLMDPTRHL
ncbi:PREDICTED: toll-like receptor Tollo [Branchiostoma belcheri]|uniref:Toll-like receptor Tollo n=1 Tax=Branchiostoma belcheri TaxID=7741 RepID=A0A6P4YBN8_BRABE|nr:PREDICTED: toll-like receptor Tollo [Branchiostoma belcheri]